MGLGDFASNIVGGAAWEKVPGVLQAGGRAISGTVDPGVYSGLLGGVQAPDQSAYQIGGLGDYQTTMGGLAGQVPGAQDYQGANADQMGKQTALQSYFQNIAMGGGQTAADQMLQNSQARAGQQLQSGMVSQGGMNPALGMRQMANSNTQMQGQVASQGAAQKLKEQEDYGQMAQNSSSALVQQKMAQMQQQYKEQMQGVQAKADIANGIFNSNRAQTSNNIEYANNKSAYEKFQYQAKLQAAKDQAAGNAALIKMIVQGGISAGGMALGMGMGGGFAGAAGSALGGAAGNAMFSSPQGSVSANDINASNGYGSFDEGATNPYMNGPNSLRSTPAQQPNYGNMSVYNDPSTAGV